MSTPAIHTFETLTALLAGVREADRVGRFVHAYCKKTDCARRFHSRPLDYWNTGRRQRDGKPVPLRTYLRCDLCKTRLAHYRVADTPEC